VAKDTVFRALADPSRRAIYERLTRGGAALKDLTERPLIDWITHYQVFWLEHLDRLQALLKEMDQ
jgi:hypothetical protein